MTQTTRIGKQNNPALLRDADLGQPQTNQGYRLIIQGARAIISALGWDRLNTIAGLIAARYTALSSAPAKLGSELPVVSNIINARVGKKLSVSTHRYDGVPTPVLTYQWVRGASTDIAGATLDNYTPQVADVGSTIKVKVTATNGVGSPLTETSAPTNAVLAA